MENISLRKPEPLEEPASSHVEQLFVRSPSVVSRRVAGETLIVPVRAKVGDLASIYSFNSTGSLIWQSLESPRSLAYLIAVVEQAYAVERDHAERDVKQFLNDMLAANLVEVRARACEESHQEVSIVALDATAKPELHAANSQ